MRTFDDVPEVVRRGRILITYSGKACELVAFLAGPRDDGAVVVADEIFDRFAGGDSRLAPSRFIDANRAYLNAFAAQAKCQVENLIGVRGDGRYWCVHQVGVQYARWISPILAVAFDAALIAFAKERLAKANEWIDGRSIGFDTAKYVADTVDKEVDDIPGKKGLKYALIHSAANGPMNRAQGGPESTAEFKKQRGVPASRAAMDDFDIPWINALNTTRSVGCANIRRKRLRDCKEAANEMRRVSEAYADLTKRLLSP